MNCLEGLGREKHLIQERLFVSVLSGSRSVCKSTEENKRKHNMLKSLRENLDEAGEMD